MDGEKDNDPVEPEKTEVVERDNEPVPPETTEVTPFSDDRE